MSELKNKVKKPRKPKKDHYVNNKKMLEEIIIYKAKCAEAEAAGKPQPQLSRYLGECLLLIANNLARAGNFSSYSYKDEMISDGIENCLMYFNNFNPDRSSNPKIGPNPFSYFTQIIYFAFLRRIAKEKKQAYIKQKLYSEPGMFEGHDESGEHGTQPIKNNKTDSARIQALYDSVEKPVKKRRKVNSKKKGVDQFVDETDNE